MSTYAERTADQSSTGLTGSILLHLVLAALIVAATYLTNINSDRWGEHASTAGAIQASMVSAIPLPQRAPPVKNSVLASDDVSPVPAPQPKEATAPPPKPTDVLLKAKPPEATKLAPIPTPTPPRHPQPTPPTPKAADAEAATQIPESVNQVQNGTASLTVQSRTFGDRYAYYLRIVGNKISQNWLTQEADPRTSMGRSVTLIFDIEQDGSPANVRVLTSSGSPSLDSSAMHALQRIETFGPLPAGNQIAVEDTFNYHN